MPTRIGKVDSAMIGERVMGKLWPIDPVAYIRFKSEYLQYATLGDIRRALDEVMQRPQEVRDQRALFDGSGGASS